VLAAKRHGDHLRHCRDRARRGQKARDGGPRFVECVKHRALTIVLGRLFVIGGFNLDGDGLAREAILGNLELLHLVKVKLNVFHGPGHAERKRQLKIEIPGLARASFFNPPPIDATISANHIFSGRTGGEIIDIDKAGHGVFVVFHFLGVVLDNVIVELFVAVAKRGTLSITERVLFLRRWGCTTAEIGTPIASIRTDLLEGRRKKERKEEVSRYFQGGLYI
jgi:hypothetical protein